VPNLQQLSDATLRAAVLPESGTVMLWDATVRQFGVRISSGGAKSFIILVGSGKRQTIGRYPVITLAQARVKAKSIFAERTLGRHQPQNISWDAARDEFLEARKRNLRPRTHEEYERTLRSYFGFGTSRLGEVSKSDVARKLDKLKDAPSQQDHALVVAKLFFNWCIKRGYIDHNPTIASVRNKATKRKRILTDEELKAVWIAAGQTEGYFGTIVRLLILTGQRRGEVGALHSVFYSHNQQTVCLPETLTKNKLEHTFPVGPLASQLIKTSLPDEPGLLFPAKGKPNNAFNGWSKSKAALDKLSGVTGWRLHDLRRTFRTNLGKLGVTSDIAERLVNHISAQSDMEQTYDVWTYLPEMRKAMELWEGHLSKVLPT
jgi:integrase